MTVEAAASPMITGSEYIAAFLASIGCRRVYTLTGGACAFMVDAVARSADLELICVQHEQSAAMAADATWRTDRTIGATMATSGPGATNLITGIACSYFDSIPSIHITGQVNQRESSSTHGASVRQSGFQETKIVDMVRPITKRAVMVRSTDELRVELAACYAAAVEGRPGPVLIDVPMDVQQALMTPEHPPSVSLGDDRSQQAEPGDVAQALALALRSAERPIVLWGGGIQIAGMQKTLASWLSRSTLPFVSSWAGLSGFNHDHPGFVGQIGVYGNRGANFVLQNADLVVVLGSRLDNRQRSGNAEQFASGAKILVLDVDVEELRKYGGGRYEGHLIDLAALPEILASVEATAPPATWCDYVADMKSRYFGKETSDSAKRLNSLSPYDVVRRLSSIVDDDAVVIADTGAAVCWLFQGFSVKGQNVFTAGGNSPMGYALPAAIGAKLSQPDRQVISYNGDGGFQLNIQDLQTVAHHDLDICFVVMNNGSYGIIKQFQDSYLGGRYSASRDGYSAPDFGKIAEAYGLKYVRVTEIDQLTPDILKRGAVIIDVMLSEHTLIEPKLEMGRPINDQYPYLSHSVYSAGNRFVAYPRPDTLKIEAMDEDG